MLVVPPGLFHDDLPMVGNSPRTGCWGAGLVNLGATVDGAPLAPQGSARGKAPHVGPGLARRQGFRLEKGPKTSVSKADDRVIRRVKSMVYSRERITYILTRGNASTESGNISDALADSIICLENRGFQPENGGKPFSGAEAAPPCGLPCARCAALRVAPRCRPA